MTTVARFLFEPAGRPARRLKEDVIGNQGDSLDIYLGDGNGNFATARHFDNLPGVCDINAGDFNGDGDLDIVFAGTDGVYLMIANP